MVVVNSRATGESVGIGPDVRVVHPGVDLERFAPGPPDEAVRRSLGGLPGVPLIGIVGRVDPGKGVHVLLEAMAEMDCTEARLAIVGDVGVAPPAFIDDLRRLAAEALGERVCFAGRRSDVAEVLRALDILVNASDAEPFGRSVLEAQACAVPVVATSAGGIPEFVQHEVTGLLVSPGRADELAAALDRLIQEEGLMGELGANARRQAEQRFGLDSRYDVLAAYFRELAAHPAPPSTSPAGGTNAGSAGAA
jgi:glycosyltransferase involved in cell wall biosynthesis